MYLDNNNHFYGEISGRTIKSFLDFDYNLKTTEERIDHLYKVLETYEIGDSEFYHEYFDEVYDQDRKFGKINIVIGKDKSQYTESNVAKALEIMANYILVVDEKEKGVDYKIYESEELFNRACQEYKLVNSIAKANGGQSMRVGDNNGETPEPFPIFQLPKNYKKVKDLKLEKDDLEKYPYMNDYYNFYEYLKEESKRLWSKGKLTREESIKRGKIKKLLPEVKKDMMEVKKQLQMAIIWKSPLKDEGYTDYDELDMFDKNVVKELLKVHKQVDLQDDLSCILVDLENLIKKINFTKRQGQVLRLWTNNVGTFEIAKELKIKPQTVVSSLNSVIDLIVKQYGKEYEEWYYLNIRRGKYKRCNKCGEVKLVSQFDKNGKKGLLSICKKCRKK